MKKIIFVIVFCTLMFIGCGDTEKVKTLNYNENLSYKYKTEINVYYTSYHKQKYIVYSNNEVYTCSFQGTNFLLEKDNSEELISTTAPIQIIETEKIENN